jgi:hypothetical protein
VRSVQAALLALAVLAPSLPASAVDLTGTWHVLVHYQDKAAKNAEAQRWEDRIWVIRPDGERLTWIDYPILVLSDDSGRFDGRKRVLEYWTPNPAQASELASGPTVNTRGSKTKSLRGSDAAGWKSANKQQQSVAFITYEETWTIDDAAGNPVFTRTDVLGGGGADDAEGRTLYKTTTVEEGGKVLKGSFDRDGTRTGTFTLTRVGDVKMLSTDGPTPNEKQAEAVRKEIQRRIEEGLDLGEEP